MRGIVSTARDALGHEHPRAAGDGLRSHLSSATLHYLDNEACDLLRFLGLPAAALAVHRIDA